MSLLCLILFVLTAALWFFLNEYDGIFGVYYPTCALRHKRFLVLVLTVMLAGVGLAGLSSVPESVTEAFAGIVIDCESVMIIVLASLITLGILKYFSVAGSACYALLGAMLAYFISSGDGFDIWIWLLSFLAAPVLAFALAFMLRKLQTHMFRKLNPHLILLSHYMRIAVVVGILMTAVAAGLSWGGFLLAAGLLMDGAHELMVPIAVSAVMVLMLILHWNRRDTSEEQAAKFADFSIYAVVSVGFSVALTLLFFSFDTTCEIIGLRPVPLSVSSMVMAAVFGTELAQKSPLVENEEYGKQALAGIVAPTGAFLLAYLFLYIAGVDAQNQLDDFVVMSAAVIVLMALLFAGYARRQQRVREATDKLVYTQQQQIYEHSRALNDMELKVVISENQALHNAVEQKRQEVMNVALSIVEQRKYLESLSDTVSRLSKTEDPEEQEQLISELSSSLRQRLSHDREVDSQYFHSQAESLHEDFNAKLSENFPDLTPQERRLAALLRLEFSSKYIATLMNITPKSVEISRYRLRQKLGLSKGTNLVNFIKSI